MLNIVYKDEEATDSDSDRVTISQSQSPQHGGLSPQRFSLIPGAPLLPPPNVTYRRNYPVVVTNGKKEEIADESMAVEPPDTNAPVNINKTRRVLFDALGSIKKHKKDAMMTKKDCFNNNLLDNFADAADFLELEESGEFIKYSAMVYGLRVDTTYSDALSTNVQLQPVNETEDELSKKTKAEKKTHDSTAAQSLNLQKLNEMSVDEPDLRHKSATPEVVQDGAVSSTSPSKGGKGDDGLLFSSDDEDEERREEELSEEQRLKVKDEKPFDSSFLTLDYLKTTSINDVIKNEVKRRARNLNRTCSLNPMLMDDETKYRMAPATLLSNEYYQVSTARYKDLNAAGMLIYNAKITHNGRMTLMHKRMDTWIDDDASDETEPTHEFRFAASGLLENSLRPFPVALKNELFDDCDRPMETKLTTGKDLQKIEKVARKKVLESDDLALLDQDGHGLNGAGKYPTSPSPKQPNNLAAVVVGEGLASPSSRPESSASSMNPSTSAAETEASESKTDNEEEDRIKEDLGVLHPPGKKISKATTIASLLTEDDIPNGPTLVFDYVAADFQRILSEKLEMKYDDITWRFGAVAEELQCDMAMVKEESQYVANASMDLDQMHLDKMWHSKFYKKKLTEEDVKEIKERMMPLVSTEEYARVRDYLRAGLTYQFFGEEDHWNNPVIPPDEHPNFKDERVARPIEDEKEKKRFEKMHRMGILSGGIMSDAEEESAVDDFERIVVAATSIECDNPDQMISDLFDDDSGGGFQSDANDEAVEDAGPSSRCTDFTAGDNVLPCEVLGDVNMDEPVLPSLEVVTTGKADDSHWKGGKNAEKEAAAVVEKAAKKERRKKKKKPRDQEEDEEEEEKSPILRYFEISGNMLDRVKLKKGFEQCGNNISVLMETDKLLLAERVTVQPQLEYDTSLYFKPYLLPQTLHSRYMYGIGNEIVDRNEEKEDTVYLDPKVRMGHYSHMIEEAVAEGGEDIDDVFMACLREQKDEPEEAPEKEKKKRKSKKAAAEEAAAEMNCQDNADAGHDDNDVGGACDDNDGGAQKEIKLERRSRSRSVGSTTHGYAIRVEGNDADNDEADAVATVGDREYKLHLIKLDTVAMKTALSDVLTNELMESDKLDETLGHFDRAFPSQSIDGDKQKKKKAKAPMQTLHEDAEAEFEEHNNHKEPDTTNDVSQEVDFEATMLEVPDAMNVTRALFAPPKVKTEEDKAVMFGGAANSSQRSANKSVEHIHLKGHHTLKSAFTCLPARMPLGATSDVTVASTISMILHLANENNLILNQPGQYDGMNDDASTKATTYGAWMNNFEVEPDHITDIDGKQLRKSMQGISKTSEVLSALPTSDDPREREKREKLLQRLAAEQKKEKMAAKAAAARKKDAAGTSSSSAAADDVVLNGVEDGAGSKSSVKVSVAKACASTAITTKRGTPRKYINDESEPGPSSKRTRR